MNLLREVVISGTGHRARVEGFEVAGKTGTAQKIDASGRYSMIDHVASFVGFVPASHPALVVLVSLDTPKGPKNEGGDVAAPLFAKIANEAVRLLAIPPDDPTRNIRLVAYSPESMARTTFAADRPRGVVKPVGDDPRIMSDLRGLSLREAALLAARHGLAVDIQGSGVVSGQSPLPGTPIEPGMTCVLNLSARARPLPAMSAIPTPLNPGSRPRQ
jgi:cell division protein FtsI (penicillin-binding protein 3)